MRQFLFDLNYAFAAKKDGRAGYAHLLLFLQLFCLLLPVITNCLVLVPPHLQVFYSVLAPAALSVGVWLFVGRVFPRVPSQQALAHDQGLPRLWRGMGGFALFIACGAVGLTLFFYPFLPVPAPRQGMGAEAHQQQPPLKP